MLELDVYDIVRIERSDGSVYLEVVNSLKTQACIGETDDFDIHCNTLKIDSCFGDDEDKTYKLTNVWRLDNNGDFKLVWKDGKEIVIEQCEERPADVNYNLYYEVRRERDELKEIVIEQVKEIYYLKQSLKLK